MWSSGEITEEKHEASLAAISHRGPDVFARSVVAGSGPNNLRIHIGFARLQIQGTPGPEQPFLLTDGRIVLVNGEVFNAPELVKLMGLSVPDGASDCAVIPALLNEGKTVVEVSRLLDGDFAICVIDPAKETATLSRDPYGVRPLYFGYGNENGVGGIMSELKGFRTPMENVRAVPPGTTVELAMGSGPVKGPLTTEERWHQIPWLKTPMWGSSADGLAAGSAALRQALEVAVDKRLATVRAVGACLSGGLDSSLVAALAATRLRTKGIMLHTYSIGMEGSPDLFHARLVADHIQSIHHECIVTAAECFDAVPTTIRAIETFDITTVRASVPNFLLARFIATTTPDVKVILNGDGSDEVLGGYLYMRKAPDDVSFEAEIDRLLREIHMFDVARSERTMAAFGLESRSPFLDRQFVAVARGLPTGALRSSPAIMEKALLRSAFASEALLPDAVLWRRKEAFSDGISRAEDSWFKATEKLEGSPYTVNPPLTSEALRYRRLFHEALQFIDPVSAAMVVAPHMWMPRFVTGATDPSARTLTGLYA